MVKMLFNPEKKKKKGEPKSPKEHITSYDVTGQVRLI